ncbi:MAG TPA: DUF4412 domain-containing protein [Gemmatimonadaceae bacterium]|jgi:hypothetical protein|nr:DUF4412 domain-containing protein [Gemmatimonadaceae bacterium]
MDRRLHVLLVALLAVAGPAGAQGSFEGAVTYQLTGSTGKPITMVYQTKGTKVRMDIGGGDGMDASQPALIYDQTSRMVMAMVVSAHMYVATSLDSLAKSSEQTKPTVKATGTHETIAGIACDNYLVTNGDHQGTVCAAHGMGNFFLPRQGAGMGFETVTLANGFFPLKVSSVHAGQSSVDMVATRVERRAVDPSVFVVPADYKQLDAKAVGITPDQRQ